MCPFVFTLTKTNSMTLASSVYTYESAPHFSSVCMCQFFGWTLTETNWMAPQSVHAHESTPLSFSFVCVNLFLLWLKPTQWHLHLLYIHMNQQHHTLVQFICINFLVLLWLKIYMSKYHQSQSETNFFLFGAQFLSLWSLPWTTHAW